MMKIDNSTHNVSILRKFKDINYVIVKRNYDCYQQYVACFNFDYSDNTWGQGHYFETYEKAFNYICEVYNNRALDDPIINECNLKKGDKIKAMFCIEKTIKAVIQSYYEDSYNKTGICVEFIATDGQYYYYKQPFDGGYVERRYINSNGMDCTDIFKKYGY